MPQLKLTKGTHSDAPGEVKVEGLIPRRAGATGTGQEKGREILFHYAFSDCSRRFVSDC
jgi:hypothetical protein